MSYIKPSVLIYQDLANSGGVANATPDLECCIIGPAYNIVQYIPGSLPSQVETAVQSTVSTTGSITSGTTALTVVTTGGLADQDLVLVQGAGASGGTLQATILNISGNVVTLDTAASTTVTSAIVSLQGILSNADVSNTYVISGGIVGQVIDSASVNIWLDNVVTNTLNTGVESYIGGLTNNVVNFPTLVSTPTATVTAPATTFSVTSVNGLAVGDSFTLAGAGVAGGLFTGTILTLTGGSITFATPTSTTVSNSAVFTKLVPVNLNSTTNTLRSDVGDTVKITYTNNTSGTETFTSEISSVVTSSGSNGTIESFVLVDSLPSDLCKTTTGTTTQNSTAVSSVVSTSGFVAGNKIVVKGAGLNGGDLLTTIVSFVTNTSMVLGTAALTAVSATTIILYNSTMSLSVLKTYNNQLLNIVKPISGGANYSIATIGTNNQFTLEIHPELPYGVVVSANVYAGYRALRTDLSSTVLAINDVNDLEGQLGVISDQNPLGLGCQIALANTTTRVRAIAVASADLIGYQAAFELSEGERLYYVVPLTQELDIVEALATQVVQLSTPQMASWRVAVVNTAIPTKQNIGQYSLSYQNSNAGANTVTLVSGSYVLTASNATFMSDGVVPGDMVNYSSAVYEVLSVISNQQLILNATAPASAVSYYITRVMTKTQQAEVVQATSTGFNSNRVWHIQPDIVGVTVNGTVMYLPGYYLACGLAGMGAGFPVQQGFTNIGVAGIADLKDSNFYFSRTDIDNLAGSGTCLFVQDTQGGIPYCRHELTTNMTVLEYREMLVVKNWDFLSYYFYDILKGFIGSWNITTDTLNTIRQVIIASAEQLIGEKLPRIGAPLLGYSITSLKQDPVNKDTADAYMSVSVVYPLNYLDLHLVI